MAETEKPKRRIMLINKRFQLGFVLWVVVLIVISSACSAVLLYLMLFSSIGDQLWISQLQISNAWSIFRPSFITGYLLSIIIVCLAAAIVVVRTSHRIAGPAYRFQVCCNEVKKGNFDVSPRIRHGDKLTDLAMAFGEMLGSLRMMRKEQLGILNDAVSISKSMRQLQSESPENEELLTSLDERLSRLAVKIGWKAAD